MNGAERNSSSNESSGASARDPPADQPAEQARVAQAHLLRAGPELIGRDRALALVEDPQRGLREPVVEVGDHRTRDDQPCPAPAVLSGRRTRAPDPAHARQPPRGVLRSPSTTARIPRAPRRCSSFLSRAGAHAIFFMVGEQVARRPQLAREIASRGAPGRPSRLPAPPPAANYAPAAVRGRQAGRRGGAEATGGAPTYHRPHIGIYSAPGLSAAREHHLEPLLWSRWGKDWRRFTTPERIAARATRDARRAT